MIAGLTPQTRAKPASRTTPGTKAKIAWLAIHDFPPPDEKG